jgi:AraC-like DNA-binding protein
MTPTRDDRPLFDVPLLPVERLLYQGELVCIGRFDSPAGHALFEDSGPTTTNCIVFPRSTVWIAHEGRLPFVADRTTVTLYNRHDRYRRAVIDPRGDRADWIAYVPDVLHEIVGAADPDAPPERPFQRLRAPCRAGAYLAERWLVRHLEREADGGLPLDRLLVEETAVRLAEDLTGGPQVPAARGGRRTAELVEAARAILAGSFRARLSLRALARALGISPYRLCHAFGASAGGTISQHLDRLRLHAALDLLASREWRLVDVALEVGYSSHSHFTARFRRAFGVTPSEARRGLTTARRREMQALLCQDASRPPSTSVS